ncbi:MAG TPA: large-conductance mechanosensitive channel protein MscL [Myxococcota bacterium]|nr:large-conductance mechanosensitive channel protein MscL [Myxococcota bacterium]
MSLLGDFRDFVNRGNVMDLAVGVIIGAAFGKIVSSLVGDVLMPVIGIVMGGVNFGGLALQIGGSDAAPVLLKYGSFIQAIIDFLIIAFCVFMLVRFVNALQKPKAAAPAPPTAQEKLLMEIRDLLRARS